MEKQIFDMLVKMQSSMEEMQGRMGDMQGSIGEMNDRLIRVEETVNRIEASQTEDVIRLLKVTKKKSNFEIDYLNSRLTEMDKRLFNIEKRIEN